MRVVAGGSIALASGVASGLSIGASDGGNVVGIGVATAIGTGSLLVSSAGGARGGALPYPRVEVMH
eukprot:2184233-Pleurochrysis_carterae.AAC.1